MFSSLRARLWLSYAILIFIALGVAAILFLVYLWQNPILYRSTLEQLNAVQLVVRTRAASSSGTDFETILQNVDDTFDVRMVVVRNERVVYDTRPAAGDLNVARLASPIKNLPTLRDANGQVWLYSAYDYNGLTILALEPRQKLALVTLLRNDLFAPFVRGGFLALVVALLLAFWLARWVADPLQRMVKVSQQVPDIEVSSVTVGGPREVQDVMRAFNAMLARVQSSQKAQKAFVANVSHELKTPLTSIQGFAQALLDGTASTPESQHQSAEVIYNESGRMHRMVLDLLDLARMDSGMAELEYAPLDMIALLNSIAEKFTPQARQAGITLSVHAVSLPVLMGDGDRLAQVFTNLVDNALKYTPDGGQVQLIAETADGKMLISVQDSGQGIPSQALAHIFDRFFQVDQARSGGDRHGTGLGLAIAHEIVQAHSGKISVRSKPGQGSLFTVELPLSQP